MPTRANTSTELPIREMFLRRNVPNLICEELSPQVFVPKKTGKYYRYDESNIVLEDDRVLSSRGGANETDHDFTTDTFEIVNYGLKEWIDGDVYDDADPPVQSEARPGTLMNIKDKLLIGKEKDLADVIFDPANFPGQTAALAGANRWDDPNSDPLANFVTAAKTVLENSGYMINTLVLGYEAMLGLQYNPAVLDLLGDNSEKAVTKAILSKILMANGVNIPEQNIYVGAAQYKTKLSAASTFIWGKKALFAYVDKRANTRHGDTLVKTFRLKGNKGDTYEFYPDPDKSKNGEWCYAKLGYQHKLVNYKTGYLYDTVVS